MRRAWTLILVLAAAALAGVLYLTLRPAPTPQADAQTMRVAAQLYDTGQFEEAAAMFQQLADGGLRGTELYYNLGTTYQAAGDLGRGVYYLRMAEVLAPRDPDIQANLALARAAVGARAFGGDVFEQALRQVSATLSLDETAALALALWLLFALLVLLVSGLRPGAVRALVRFVMLVVGIVTFAAVLTFGVRFYRQLAEPPAVVIAGSVAPRPSPGGEPNTRLALPAGSEVTITALDGPWALITLPGSQAQGWVSADALRPLT